MIFLFTQIYIKSDPHPLIDLDTYISDFILEEKQIIIPEYPDAFNPSIVRWYDGRLLLSFRTRDPETKVANLLGFVWLDEEFEPISKPSLLRIYSDFSLKVSKMQGARILKTGSTYSIVYNNILNTPDQETRRMVVATLNYDKNSDTFSITKPKYILSFDVDKKQWREKNWIPFYYKQHLYLAYSLNPHHIFQLHRNENTCQNISITNKHIEWPWGDLHGGTPSILDNGQFLGFFHSDKDLKTVQSNGEKITHYFIGAYCFKPTPPFTITAISALPIVGKTFYESDDFPTWKPLKVVYPTGFVLDKFRVSLVYGRQDHQCWVVIMDKEKLLKSLQAPEDANCHQVCPQKKSPLRE